MSHNFLKQMQIISTNYQRTCDDSIDYPKRHPRNKIIHDNRIKDDECTMEELNFTIAKLKNNKTPGTDELSVELTEFLDTKNREKLWIMINKAFLNGKLEEHLPKARVVSLYKE